jgi:hypothetical protein
VRDQADLERDHVVIAGMPARPTAWAREIAEPHFTGEEKRPARVLDALGPADGIRF